MKNLSLKNCRVCKSELIINLWELAPAPYGDLYCENYVDAINLKKIDLTLQMCESCKFIQLGQNVEIDTIYKNYLYNSSITPNLSNYYNRSIRSLKNLFDLKKTDLIIDIGSNDGTYLKHFSSEGFKVLGVEPSKNQSLKAINSGIPTINDYLTTNSVESILSTYGKAKLVSANYVVANVPDPIDFFRNLKKLMENEGILSIITGYHPDQFSINMFEYINHDHLSYFSVSSISHIAKLVGLELFYAERVEHKGGSIHLLLQKQINTNEVSETVTQLLQRENWMNVQNSRFYELFQTRINNLKTYATENLPSKNLIGIGASISTTHLLHEFEIGERFKVIFDQDKNKINTYSPGYGIEVNDFENLNQIKKGNVVILAWQHAMKISQKLKQINNNFEIIEIMPTLGGLN